MIVINSTTSKRSNSSSDSSDSSDGSSSDDSSSDSSDSRDLFAMIGVKEGSVVTELGDGILLPIVQVVLTGRVLDRYRILLM